MSDGDDPTEDMVRAEIAAAVKILREDGLHVRKTIGDLLTAGKPAEPPAEEETEPKEGDPPPKKEKPAATEKKGIWWR